MSDNISDVTIQFIDEATGEASVQLFTKIYVEGYEEAPPISPTNAGSIFTLPINPHDNKITYVFMTNDVKEQISFIYTKMPRLLSSACPHEILYQQLQVVDEETTFKYKLVKNELNNSETPNVEILL